MLASVYGRRFEHDIYVYNYIIMLSTLMSSLDDVSPKSILTSVSLLTPWFSVIVSHGPLWLQQVLPLARPCESHRRSPLVTYIHHNLFWYSSTMPDSQKYFTPTNGGAAGPVYTASVGLRDYFRLSCSPLWVPQRVSVVGIPQSILISTMPDSHVKKQFCTTYN